MRGYKTMKTLCVCAAALCVSSAAWAQGDSPAHDATTSLYMEYSGTVLIFPIADLQLNARLSENDYAAAANFQSAGLLSWFDDTHIEATAVGYIRDDALVPYRYEHVNHASSKGRVVGIDFPDGVATPDVNPPFGSMGEPPASFEERDGAADPVSVLLSLTIDALRGEDACSGVREVFDGKARYNLRFESSGADRVRTRAYDGDAEHCRAFLDPISGYDPDERPSAEDVAKPIHIWLAEVDGHTVPVKFRADTQVGNITVVASRIQVSSLMSTGGAG